MNMNKTKEVFSDEAFVKSLFDLETPEEVQAALKEKEIEMTTEEICQMRDLLIRYQDGELTEEEQKALELAEKYSEGELSEEELENVSSGCIGCACVIGLTLLCMSIVGLLEGVCIHEATRGRW